MGDDRPAVRAVVFDVDGTLYDREQLRSDYFIPLVTDPPELGPVWYGAFNQIREEQIGGDLVREELRRIAAALQLSEEQAAAALGRMLGEDHDRALARVGPRPGLTALLDALVSAGLRIALMTDRPLGGKLRALGLEDRPWSARVVGLESGALKPAPAIFRRVAEALDLPADQLLYVGDREDTDVLGAIGAGWSAALIGDRAAGATRAHYAGTSFDALREAFVRGGILTR
jgi:putative hydrolase of the HAD superfamily